VTFIKRFYIINIRLIISYQRIVREIDDTHIVYSQEDEVRGMNVQLGMEGTNSNGHGYGKTIIYHG
jgi:hypothetical protein